MKLQNFLLFPEVSPMDWSSTPLAYADPAISAFCLPVLQIPRVAQQDWDRIFDPPDWNTS